jgi:hypothetical protein
LSYRPDKGACRLLCYSGDGAAAGPGRIPHNKEYLDLEDALVRRGVSDRM